MRTAQYHDRRHNPVGLWNFHQSLADQSGNGFDLQIDVGTERYASLLPGLVGFYFDGATRLNHPTPETELQIAGDLTGEVLFFAPRQLEVQTTSPTVFGCGIYQPSIPAENFLYDLNVGAEGDVRFSSDTTGFPTTVVILSEVCATNTIPLHFAFTRITNVYRVYINGQLYATSAVQRQPDGGSSGLFWVGSAGERGGSFDPFLERATLASIKIIDFGLTDSQVAEEYERTLGPVYGALAA